ncbi:putative acetyltransferase [compost metagenome]
MSLRIEELALNAWPALRTIVHEGWLLRFADGYTKRSNSISAIYSRNEDKIERRISNCEEIYATAGLQTIFKITPFVSDSLDQLLSDRDYMKVEPSSVKILDNLQHIPEPQTQEITIENQLSEQWLRTIARMNGLSSRDLAVSRKLLSGSPLKHGFFTLHNHSRAVACGLAVIEQGYVGLYDIVTAKEERNQGHGEQLLLHILKWAEENGAAKSYVLVVQNNAPANRLYEKLNYQHAYTYWYRCKPAR